MFIRRTQTRSRVSGEPYVTHRLVQSVRVGNAIKQTTLLNLGSHFNLPQVHWPALAQRIDESVRGQRSMLDATLPEEVRAFAHRFAAQLIAHQRPVPSLGAASASPAAAVSATPAAELSCRLCDGNPFEYLNALAHHAQAVIGHAANWLPWNYREQVVGDP